MIQILITGGTIDKHYDESGVLTFKDSKIPSIIDQGRFNAELAYQQVMLKDSLDMTEDDRRIIAKACESTQAKKILITHGTDTMVETARYIASHNVELIQQKAIVLVGAMVPQTVRQSDANFNIGFALGALSSIESGIYIAMSGQIFPWNNVQKNKEDMVFEAS